MKKISQTVYLFSEKISSARKWRKSFLLLSIYAALIIFSGGCKDEDQLGLKIIPPSDQVSTEFNDTTTVVTLTMAEDSLRTDELSVQLLGSDKDPVFGPTTASVYTQVNLEGTPAFGTSPVADSLVLFLSYSGYYGDTTQLQTIDVYHMTENMFIDSPYYSNRNFNYDAASVGSLTFSPQPTTPDTIYSVAYAPHIRIHLSNTLADSIILLNGQAALSSNALWLAYFKGLYLKAQTATLPAAISYFNFFNSGMRLYFHNDTDDSLYYDFSLTGARLNQFVHDYTTTDVGNQLQSPSPSDSINYLQSMAGVKIKVTFPYLKHFIDSGSILINRAELKITAEAGVIPYSLPTKVLLVTKNDAGEIIFPIDYYESSGYYGGDLNSTADGYTFNIVRQLQGYLDGTVTNADFYIIVSGSGIEANRAIINSGSNATSRMKLSLFYTKLY